MQRLQEVKLQEVKLQVKLQVELQVQTHVEMRVLRCDFLEGPYPSVRGDQAVGLQSLPFLLEVVLRVDDLIGYRIGSLACQLHQLYVPTHTIEVIP